MTGEYNLYPKKKSSETEEQWAARTFANTCDGLADLHTQVSGDNSPWSKEFRKLAEINRQDIELLAPITVRESSSE